MPWWVRPTVSFFQPGHHRYGVPCRARFPRRCRCAGSSGRPCCPCQLFRKASRCALRRPPSPLPPCMPLPGPAGAGWWSAAGPLGSLARARSAFATPSRFPASHTAQAMRRWRMSKSKIGGKTQPDDTARRLAHLEQRPGALFEVEQRRSARAVAVRPAAPTGDSRNALRACPAEGWLVARSHGASISTDPGGSAPSGSST